MIVKQLFDKQQQLDDYILDNLNTRTYNKVEHTDLLNERSLALLVEIGEFMEETDRQKQLYEIVDILHFLLSVGNTLSVKMSFDFEEFTDIYKEYQTSNYPVHAMSKFYINLTKLLNYRKAFGYWKSSKVYDINTLSAMYKHTFTSFLTLCNANNYSAVEVEAAYTSKYQENINRQERGY